jgi:uncharacterized protein YjbI with pentapeptide repeats
MGMTRKILIQSIAKDTGLSQRKSSEILSVLLNSIISALASGDFVLLRKFGKFQAKERKARRVKHPVSGNTIIIEKRRAVAFKCSYCLKDLLNEELVDPAFVESNQAGLQMLYDLIETGHKHLDKKKLKSADLKGTDLSEGSFSMLNLANADLSNADLFGADFQDSNLERVNLDGAVIMWTNLEGANLYKASLQGADLRWANLAGADLTKANLKFANLKGANLNGAKLAGAKLHGAKLSNTDLKNADFKGSNPDVREKFARLRVYFSKPK